MPLVNCPEIGSFGSQTRGIFLEVKLPGRHTQIGGIITGLGHEHAVGAQSHAITNRHSLQYDTGHTQQVIVTDGNAAREMCRGHEPIKVTDHIVMPHNHVVVDEIEIADRDIAGNHAVILDDIALAHLQRVAIDQEQGRVNQVGERDIGIADAFTNAPDGLVIVDSDCDG